MMEKELYLSKLHTELLSIIEAVDKVCRDHNLKYYLVGGTLLGAVRHKGFIPWDDDLDIAMPRKDFEKFISIASHTLEDDYELQWITTNKKYWHVFAKVVKKKTLFKEFGLKKFEPHGIFIDIFPLDFSSQYTSKTERIKRKTQRILSIISQKNKSFQFNRFFVFKLLSFFISTKRLQNIIISVMKSAQKEGITHYANFGSQYALSKQTMPTEWYGEGVRIPFERLSLVAPTEYIKVLESIYGPKFMQLPPENKRRCHYPEKVIFSDGEEVKFEKPIHIVTIQEQENN